MEVPGLRLTVNDSVNVVVLLLLSYEGGALQLPWGAAGQDRMVPARCVAQ